MSLNVIKFILAVVFYQDKQTKTNKNHHVNSHTPQMTEKNNLMKRSEPELREELEPKELWTTSCEPTVHRRQRVLDRPNLSLRCQHRSGV